MPSLRSTIALASVVFLLPATIVHSAIDTWKSGTTGLFHVGTNWTDGTVPTAADIPLFNPAGTYAVQFGTFTPDPTVPALTVAIGNVTFQNTNSVANDLEHSITLTSSETAFALNSGSLTLLGDSGNRTMRLHVHNNARIEGNAVLNVVSQGRFDPNGILFVGESTTGSLIVTEGGIVTSGLRTIVGNSATGVGTATVSGIGSQLNSNMLVGSGGTGTLTINSGGTVYSVASSIVGANSGSHGAVTIDGANAEWVNSANLTIGSAGTGTLHISNGGKVQDVDGIVGGGVCGPTGCFAGDGTANLSGNTLWNNSRDMIIGDLATGVLNITTGGQVWNLNGTGYIGRTNLGDGTVNVSGTGSRWDNLNLSIGQDGAGRLNISNGGLVQAVSSNLGHISGSGTVSISGANARLISESLRVGLNSSGAMDISNGGLVQSNVAEVGSSTTALGEVNVRDVGSTWTINSNLDLAGIPGFSGGAGALNVGAGGTVNVGGKMTIWNAGIVDLNGGQFNAAVLDAYGTMNVSNGGTFRSGTGNIDIKPAGKINLGDGGTFDARGPVNMQGGQFNALGGTLHVDTFNGNLQNQGSTLAPGQSAGSTTIVGNYTQQTGATLEIEIGGIGTGTQYDFVHVTGTAFVDGQLALRLLNDFVPTPSQSFVAFNANSLLGVFDNAGNGQRVFTTDGLGSFLVNYGPASAFNPNQIVLNNFLANLPGDFDHDGDVDGHDFLVWQRNTSVGNLADWEAHFGSGMLLTSATASVPEPRTICLLLFVFTISSSGCARLSRGARACK